MKRDTTPRGRRPRDLVYRRLEEAIAELRERMGGLPSPIEAKGIWTSIWHQEAHHSTALEGNTLVLRQVETLLAEGRAVGNKELREYLEVSGYASAARWVYQQALEAGDWNPAAPVSLTEVRHVHALALGPVWEVAPHPVAGPLERPESFRRHYIEPFPEGMVPPPGSRWRGRSPIGWGRLAPLSPPTIPSKPLPLATLPSSGSILSLMATAAPVASSST